MLKWGIDHSGIQYTEEELFDYIKNTEGSGRVGVNAERAIVETYIEEKGKTMRFRELWPQAKELLPMKKKMDEFLKDKDDVTCEKSDILFQEFCKDNVVSWPGADAQGEVKCTVLDETM